MGPLQVKTSGENTFNVKIDNGPSADSVIYDTAYYTALVLSHAYIGYNQLGSYMAGVVVGSTVKLVAHYNFAAVKPDAETSWEKKSGAFGDASIIGKIYAVTNDVIGVNIAKNFHYTYNDNNDTVSFHKPFVFMKGWMLGNDLTTRAIRWLSTDKNENN